MESLILKIVKPIWYFSIFTKKPKNFIDYKSLDKKTLSKINICYDYSSEELTEIDAMYQLINKGFIIKSNVESYNYIDLENNSYDITIKDQYLFLRRMYKSIWIYYILILKIISFKIKLEDFISIYKTKKIKQLKVNNKLDYDDYNTFKSDLVKEKPNISIILPTLNRYANLENILKDLEKQTYKNFEIIIIDQSNPFKANFYDKFQLNTKVFFQEERGLWKARNLGIQNSSSDFFLFLDDDSVIDNTWIFEHLKCIDFFNADISAGVSISIAGAPVPINYSFFRLADQLDTGNVMIKKEVFKKCGLFDLQFEKMRMGDGEFGLRAYLNGFKIIHNPLSKRNHLKVRTGGLREMGSWDGLRPKNILNLRPIPSVLYFYRSYWGDSNALFSLIQTIPFSLTPYSMKGRFKGYLLSSILFILFFPIIIYKVFKSWRYSGKMIKTGPIIEKYTL